MSDFVWVSVKNRVPETRDDVIAHSESYGTIVANYEEPGFWCFTVGDGDPTGDVTHWAAIPPLPKEEK